VIGVAMAAAMDQVIDQADANSRGQLVFGTSSIQATFAVRF
jgi:hypothetical protein